MPDTPTPIYYVCFLNNFNNYFNRIIKGFATLAEYQTAVGTDNYYLFSKPVNYNPNDNVSTELIMNDCPFDPDYVLFLDSSLEIVSRWFVMEGIFTRQKQKKYELRRDVIYDYREGLMDSPIYIQKAFLEDSNPLILNSEGMSFNEIKSEETLLKDRTNSAWIVGYIAKNAAASDITITLPQDTFTPTTLSAIASATGISEATLGSLLNFDGSNTTPAYFVKSIKTQFATVQAIGSLEINKYIWEITNNPSFTSGGYTGTNMNLYLPYKELWTFNSTAGGNQATAAPELKDQLIANKASILSQLPSIFSRPYLTQSQLDILQTFSGEIIFYNGVYYRLNFNITQSDRSDSTGRVAYTTYSSFATAVNAATGNLTGATVHNDGKLTIIASSVEVYIQAEEISLDSGIIPSVQTKVSSSRNKIKDQAFDMFAIPYGPAKYKDQNGDQTATPDFARAIAAKIAVELDSSCYDVQLLPYCPVLDLFDSNNEIDLTALSENVDFNYIDVVGSDIYTEMDYCTAGFELGQDIAFIELFLPYDIADVEDYSYEILEGDNLISSEALTVSSEAPNEIRVLFKGDIQDDRDADRIFVKIVLQISGMIVHKSFIVWPKNNSFRTEINHSLTLKDSMKIESQCNKYRLCSPNYQGSFDFNVASNGGSVNYFIAECSYKPYTPYIKVCPAFDWMYGTNYGDNRGLICGGDFSLPRFTSAWETFELNNKNYQNIFNREIQNLKLEQSLQERELIISGGLGVMTAGIAGAGVGAKAGGVYGAIAGAAIGTVGSAAGMAVDIDTMGQRHREAKQFSLDKFNYQLGNIKALPYTLTKIGSFDINSKIWPFLEYYTCTTEEKETLELKITYESMTVMKIGTFANYFEAFPEKHYFKGELIRNEAIAEDNHIFEAIYNELLKGVYI